MAEKWLIWRKKTKEELRRLMARGFQVGWRLHRSNSFQAG